MQIMNEEFYRKVDPNQLIRAERRLKSGVYTQKEYEGAIGRARITLDSIKPILTVKITHEEFEARHCGSDAYWVELKSLMLESDEIWEFASGEAFASRSGVVIIRDGEVAASFLLGIG